MYHFLSTVSMVHTEDVARTIFSFLNIQMQEGDTFALRTIHQFLSLLNFFPLKTQNITFQEQSNELKHVKGYEYKPSMSKKLLDTGLKY
ncbi:hypothetical protein RJ641_005198, partial [Dillenia turbinata]